jgi:hypothetical protein
MITLMKAGPPLTPAGGSAMDTLFTRSRSWTAPKLNNIGGVATLSTIYHRPPSEHDEWTLNHKDKAMSICWAYLHTAIQHPTRNRLSMTFQVQHHAIICSCSIWCFRYDALEKSGGVHWTCLWSILKKVLTSAPMQDLQTALSGQD